MKKFILASLILHSLLTLPLLLGKTTKQVPVEISLEPPGAEGDLDKTGNEIIKPLGEGDGEKSENFYWGLGITCTLVSNGCYISGITEGYAAMDSGLQVGDIIYLINGLPLSDDNEIRGNTPKKLYLTFSRKGITMNLVVERVKVYY